MPSDNPKAILIGYSGHGLVVAESAMAMNMELIGFTEFKKTLNNPFELKYLGYEGDKNFNWKLCSNYILGVGNNKVRSKISQAVTRNSGVCLTVVHPSSSISKFVEIDSGVFIARSVSINPNVKVGSNTILNTSCSIDHDCIIGDNVHIAPGAVLTGNVQVCSEAFVGANSVIKQGVRIGKGSIVGAGCVVLDDVPDGQVVVGNPARFLDISR